MRQLLIYLLLFSFLYACKNETKTNLVFLDEYIVKDSMLFKNSIIGGISGVDYANGFYYFVVDDAKTPRFIKAKIAVINNKIEAIDFKNVIFLNDSTSSFYKKNALDLESIFVDEETQEINFVSEGLINKDKKPAIFSTDKNGKLRHIYQLPKSFKDISNIKHNAVFEGSSKSINGKGFWIAMEEPLKIDGEEPTFYKTASPIRITYFDKVSKKATKQFAYQLEHITKTAKGNVNLNGVTAILEYEENHFFVIERTYQSSYGAYGNIVRIFEAFIDDETTNILNINSLKETEFVPLKKRLIFNFEDVKDKLTDRIIDNIEGITFGPKLENGNQSLILVADDNFQLYGKQLNQFILLEIENK